MSSVTLVGSRTIWVSWCPSMMSCQAEGAVCMPSRIAMLISPINASSHSCAQSGSMKSSKTPYQATGALGGRYTTAINMDFACGNDKRITSASTASDSGQGSVRMSHSHGRTPQPHHHDIQSYRVFQGCIHVWLSQSQNGSY